MNIWRLITHHEEPDLALAWTRHCGRIAIGWGKIGNLRQRQCNSAQDIGSYIRQSYPELSNSGADGSTVWSFNAEMQKGDLVILSGSRPRQAVVEVQGDYEFAPQVPSLNGRVMSAKYQHLRRVQITAVDSCYTSNWPHAIFVSICRAKTNTPHCA